jgi:beta-lactamase regulating signal transducer with metallopeptidase domain
MLAVLDLAARAVGVLGLVWMIAAVLRRQSASLRAFVWTCGLGALLLLPAVSGLVPSWRVPVLAPSAAGSVAESVAGRAPAGPAAGTSAPPPGVAMNVRRAPTTVAGDTPGEPVLSSAAAWDWTGVVLAAGALVIAVLLGRTTLGYWHMARVVAHAGPADAGWATLIDRTRADLGITRLVAARVTDALAVPAVAGVWKPVLLLPIEANEWPAEVRRAVVLHELAHVARWDALGQLVGQIACAFYWFVPLAWYGARRAAALRERASDDFVLAAGVPASSYAGSLIALTRAAAGQQASPAAVAMAQASRMRERIGAILDPGLRRHRIGAAAAAVVVVLVGGLTAVAAVVEPASRDTTLAARQERVAAFARAVSLVSATNPETPQAIQPPAVDRLCGGRGLDSSSSSVQEDDNRRRWTVRLSGGGCSVELRAEGRFEFNDDFTDLVRIAAGGFFRVDVTDRGVRRQLEIEPRDGALAHTWRVDGEERPYDAEARAWFAAFLIELDRRTGIGADIRLPLLLRQGGVNAVLKETALSPSDHVRNLYYTKLPKVTSLSAGDVTQVLRQAGTLTRSDHYLAELVKTYNDGRDAAVRTSLIELVGRMRSDHYQATSIAAIVGVGGTRAPDVDLLLTLVPRMSSDHYKAEVLNDVLATGSLTGAQQAAIARAAAGIGSDHYAANVLATLARSGLPDDAVRQAFLEAATNVGSDHYRGDALAAFLAAPRIAERDLMAAVASAGAMRSDHYQSEVLQRIARHPAASDKVRSAVLHAAEGMSQHYADQVRRAVGR